MSRIMRDGRAAKTSIYRLLEVLNALDRLVNVAELDALYTTEYDDEFIEEILDILNDCKKMNDKLFDETQDTFNKYSDVLYDWRRAKKNHPNY